MARPKYRMDNMVDGVAIIRNEDNRVMWRYSSEFKEYADIHLEAVNSVWEDK